MPNTEVLLERVDPNVRGNVHAAPMTVRRGDALVVALVAALAQLTYFRAVPVIVWPDSVRYVNLGDGFFRALAAGQWDLWTTPAYPLFVWLLTRVVHTVEIVILSQHILAIVTCVLVLMIGHALLGRWAGLVGALLVALDPMRHYYAQALLSESLAEFLMVAGFVALVAAMQVSAPAFLGWRALVGLLLGLAALVRPALAPAIAVAAATPLVPLRSTRRAPWMIAGALVTLVTAFLVLLPWLSYNAHRGEFGLSLNSGYTIHTYASAIGFPEDADTERLIKGAHSVEVDRELRRKVPGRFLGAPLAYVPAVLDTTIALIVPVRPRGDVAPVIATCENVGAESITFVLPPPARSPISWWRCRLHRLAVPLFALLISAGWLGLMLWSVDSLRRRRYDLAALGLFPLVVIFAHAFVLLWNTRFAFPCEALALGLGLPAGLSVALRGLAPPSRDEARPTSAP
jgi:4-amino-4-deoxy-L-arabinose transferase-like glycosyltransferase